MAGVVFFFKLSCSFLVGSFSFIKPECSVPDDFSVAIECAIEVFIGVFFDLLIFFV
ncbi:MAG: hypothetical protein LBF22_07590 [Deltaproteobacteria bacterium]|nr:hypothetical protein [Deltaproteobacteria bacterium]